MSNLLPQMSPVWWTFLMIMFLMSFIALMTVMYFEFSKEIKYKTNLNFKKMIWKW